MSTAPIPNIALASFKLESTQFYDGLLADGHDVTSMKGTIASGTQGKLYRGQILHITPSTGAIITAVTGAAATVANCVLAENIDATSATVDALVYMTGRMKASAILWPPAGAHAAHTEDLRDVGIYIESVLGQTGQMVKNVPTAEDEAAAKEQLEKNRERLKARQAEVETYYAPKPNDSPIGYMTVEEREKNPELMEPVREPEAAEEFEVDESGQRRPKTPKTPPPEAPPPAPEY